MGLVNDDGVVGLEQRVGLGFGQQDAVGHEFDGRITAQAVLKPHLVADHIAQRGFKLLCNALGHAGRRNTARLGMANQFGVLSRRVVELATPHSERDFGQLRSFARAGFTAHNDDLMGLHSRRDFIAFARYRQRFGEGNGQSWRGRGCGRRRRCGQ